MLVWWLIGWVVTSALFQVWSFWMLRKISEVHGVNPWEGHRGRLVLAYVWNWAWLFLLWPAAVLLMPIWFWLSKKSDTAFTVKRDVECNKGQ